MRKNPEYYEFYGELVSSNIFFKRLVFGLVVINIVLAFIAYLGFTRPVETYVVNDGFAYSTLPYGNVRSEHEIRQFAYEFSKNLLEFNRDNFNERIKTACQMCSMELEHLMYNSIASSEIPKVVQSTPGTIRFEIDELTVKRGDPNIAQVVGRQVFPGQSAIPVRFTITINVVNRSQSNPFGMRIINYTQEKT